MTKLKILVAEDDPMAQELMAGQLTGHRVDFAADAGTAQEKLASGKHDICFIDLKLGEKDSFSGLALIAAAKAKGAYSVVMSGHDAQEVVDKAYALGCDDFHAKGSEKTGVGAVLARFLNKRQDYAQRNLFKQGFITEDAETRAGILEALNYASANLPVLILGPSGTGKTNLARIIHEHSGRRGEFVAINCSALTDELLEAELFGFKKGAFTGATENRKGKLLAADQGTLFLDEIGSMSVKIQTKLLKAIEERSFYPLGSDKPETSQFRVISATLEDLPSLIKTGKLRFDFFQRIHGVTIELKPLARRKCDVFPLISFFTRGGGRRLSFEASAKETLLKHHWPGNIRELKTLVELLISGHEGPVTRDVVVHLLAKLSIDVIGRDFVTEEQYRFALDNGLNALVDKIVDTVIKRNLTERAGNKSRVLEALDIANRILYKSLNRGARQPDRIATP